MFSRSTKKSSREQYDFSKWDADPRHQRIAVDRRGSDSTYDPRNPGVRPEVSYYGPNFRRLEGRRVEERRVEDGRIVGRRIEGKRAESFNHRIPPKIPEPYVKNPQPYPDHMVKEYKEYKRLEKDYTNVNNALGKLSPLNVGRSAPDEVRRQTLTKGVAMAKEKRVLANTTIAARYGFDHKYPTAYESLKAKDGHLEQADQRKSGAREARHIQRESEKKMAKWGYLE